MNRHILRENDAVSNSAPVLARWPPAGTDVCAGSRHTQLRWGTRLHQRSGWLLALHLLLGTVTPLRLTSEQLMTLLLGSQVPCRWLGCTEPLSREHSAHQITVLSNEGFNLSAQRALPSRGWAFRPHICVLLCCRSGGRELGWLPPLNYVTCAHGRII